MYNIFVVRLLQEGCPKFSSKLQHFGPFVVRETYDWLHDGIPPGAGIFQGLSDRMWGPKSALGALSQKVNRPKGEVDFLPQSVVSV
jgi:hypothetical protein